eukprot:TRINITY_DN377_c0_g1_i1.p1 TRINITY_DN377_c0_g1~~TRINITY_DN377_c0_g1_i1.p1  ORF type:complete len:224 (-),score=39.22 TRINITY_DN377_c0_g1_i1:18-689(-)
MRRPKRRLLFICFVVFVTGLLYKNLLDQVSHVSDSLENTANFASKLFGNQKRRDFLAHFLDQVRFELSLLGRDPGQRKSQPPWESFVLCVQKEKADDLFIRKTADDAAFYFPNDPKVFEEIGTSLTEIVRVLRSCGDLTSDILAYMEQLSRILIDDHSRLVTAKLDSELRMAINYVNITTKASEEQSIALFSQDWKAGDMRGAAHHFFTFIFPLYFQMAHKIK